MEARTRCLAALTHLREYHTAREYLAEAYTLFVDANNPLGIAIALHNLAYRRFQVRDLDASEELFQRAITVEEKHHLGHPRAGILRQLGVLRQSRGDPRGAKVLWDRALTLFSTVGDDQGIGRVLQSYSRAHLDVGDTDRASDYCEHVLAYHIHAHDLVCLAETRCLKVVP